MEKWKCKKIIIAAPFGNYISHPESTSTVGTYTVENRAGFLRWRLVWRIIKTLRYLPSQNSWRNKLGLPNPGIEHLKTIDARGKIVSIHGFCPADWQKLLNCVHQLNPLAVELNISCPNVGKVEVDRELFREAISTKLPVVVKLPPTNYWETFLLAHEEGIRIFHCCNTLPSPLGGISGPTLKPHSLAAVQKLKDFDANLEIIGGGGITAVNDIELYQKAGADKFSIATAFFNPWFFLNYRKEIRKLGLKSIKHC